MNVVLYLRYSSERQNEQSIEGQQRICAEFCKRNDMQIIGIYTDRALSASKNTDKRIEFQNMIKASEKRNFEAVVVYKLDRFARDRYDSAIYKRKLAANGVKVISATENISDTPEGIILESLLEGMAEYYSRELSQKVQRGMRESALKGNSCGGATALGLKIVNKKYVIDEDKAFIVKELFRRVADNERQSDIADDFNARGLRTAQGKLFNKNSFHTILRNKKYIGIYEYNDIVIEDAIPAIIEKELFYEVQDRLDKLKEAPAMNKAKVEYLLSGKLFCGHCNEKMLGEYGTSKTGQKHYYYTCSTKKKSRSCDKKNVRKDWIEETVISEAQKLLTPEVIEKLADMAMNEIDKENAENEELKYAKKQIAEVEKKISNLLKLVEKGSDSESLFNRLNELENQKKQLELEIKKHESSLIKIEKVHIIWWLSKFAQKDMTDPTHKRQLINMLINSVTVYDDPDGYRITILFNLTSEKSKTIKSSDIDSKCPPNKTYPNIFILFGKFFGYSFKARIG